MRSLSTHTHWGLEIHLCLRSSCGALFTKTLSDLALEKVVDNIFANVLKLSSEPFLGGCQCLFWSCVAKVQQCWVAFEKSASRFEEQGRVPYASLLFGI